MVNSYIDMLIQNCIDGWNWGDGVIKESVRAAGYHIKSDSNLIDEFGELRAIWIKEDDIDSQTTTSWLVLETICPGLGDAIVGNIWEDEEC